MRYASKRWTETETDAGGQRRTRQRMTVYYPDRIEKYVMGPGGQWIEFAEPGQAWPTPWVDGARQPLGIPVFHFYNPGVRSELWNAVFIQDAINKSALDLLAASDTEGFRILFAHGWYPTSDGQPPKDDESNLLHVAPGQIIGSTDKDAGLTPIEGGDLSKLEAVLNGWILRLDQVTGTPTSRHQMTAQVASEATLKQQESKLIAKVEERQSLFGGAWTDCLAMARRLENLWGRKGLNEESLISIRWKPAATRDETAELGRLVLKREKLSVPLRQIWMEAGYDQKVIETMMQEPEIRNLTFATYPGAA
jgi:hypothetical protein